MGTVSFCGARRSACCPRIGLERVGGWFFNPLPICDGAGDGFLRVSGIVPFVSNRETICGGALGVFCGRGGFGGQFAGRLHVFLSLLVACAFGICGCVVFFFFALSAFGPVP